jgi:HAMP domain-containing protein
MTATWGGVLGSLAIMTGIALLIRSRVVKPLEQIVAHAQQIGEKSDLKGRLNSARTDEIGQLSQAFDEMVECLAASRKKILETAHQAGMADVASEVLHNVGNVTTVAKSCVELLEAQLQSGTLDGLQKAAELLEQNGERAAEFFSKDPRGPKLVKFLVKTAHVLARESATNRSTLGQIAKAIRHIEGIISLQEHRAHHSGFACETDLKETLQAPQEAVRQHRAPADGALPDCQGRTAVDPGTADRKARTGQRGEERVSCQHEPRDPHPFEWSGGDAGTPQWHFSAKRAKPVRARQFTGGLARNGMPLPIIGVTAHAAVDDRNKCLEAGMDGYLTKPLNTKSLIAVLEKHLPSVSAEARTAASGY